MTDADPLEPLPLARGTKHENMRALREQRLRMIDFLLAHYGTLNRIAIEDYFGIQSFQASRDIQEYLRMAPGNAAYDASAKCYRRCPGFVRHYHLAKHPLFSGSPIMWRNILVRP
jgi:hypothetical protein